MHIQKNKRKVYFLLCLMAGRGQMENKRFEEKRCAFYFPFAHKGRLCFLASVFDVGRVCSLFFYTTGKRKQEVKKNKVQMERGLKNLDEKQRCAK
jgi:hypothetical protein